MTFHHRLYGLTQIFHSHSYDCLAVATVPKLRLLSVLCVLRVLSGETYIIMCLLMENFTIAIALIAVSGISMGSWCVL